MIISQLQNPSNCPVCNKIIDYDIICINNPAYIISQCEHDEFTMFQAFITFYTPSNTVAALQFDNYFDNSIKFFPDINNNDHYPITISSINEQNKPIPQLMQYCLKLIPLI